MKPFRNRGWKWLRFMEKILPVAGATGSHSFAAAEANPPSLTDEDLDYVQVPSANNSMDIDSMDIDSISQPAASTSTSTSASAIYTNVLPVLQPATKRPRVDSDGGNSIAVAHHPSSVPPSESGSATAAPTPSIQSNRSKKSKTSEKGKGKARTGSERSSSSLITPSTSQRVDKVTPAVAIVELHGSIKDMTQAILVASKPPESVNDKAVVRCQEAVRLVQERDDGLSLMEKASLIVFFGSHDKEADMYIALKEDELRQAVVRQWIGHV